MSDDLPQLVDVRPLIGYEANARTHSEAQIEQLKDAFRRFGFVGTIAYVPPFALKIGHGRRQAAMEMWEADEDIPGPGRRSTLPKWQLPAIDVSGLDDDELRALVIADNKLALNAGWDEEMLAAELRALGELNFDLPTIGFDEKELERLFNPPPPDTGKSGAGTMAEEFLIPPFTVLNAREGWWQDRKRQWIALGIKSELGRGENLIKRSLQDRLAIIVPGQYQAAVNFIAECRAKEMDDDAIMRLAMERWGGESAYLKGALTVEVTPDAYRGGRKADAIPGGAGKNAAWRRGGRKPESFGTGSVSGDGREPGETTGDRILRGARKRGATFGQDFLDGEGGVHLARGVRRSTGADPHDDQPGQPRDRPGGLGGVTMQSLSSHPRYYEQKTAAEARLSHKLTNDEFERDHWVMPDSEIASGTSIFDPTLCELVYRWFSPPGGVVLDPFAGGSVRGIVAAALGRQYVGIDLRPEQVAANHAQWPVVAAQLGPGATPAEVPPLRVEEIEGIRVVRDDDVRGGTKRRALDRVLGSIEAEELIYATPAYGFAQIALAYACRAAGKRATVVVAGRKHRHLRTQLAAEAGAEIVEIAKGGYLTVVQKRARDLAEERGAYLVPFGMEDEIFVEAIASVARELPGPAPEEVWCVAGSGVLSRALQRAWPDAQHHAVQIGKDPEVGKARLWKAPEKFEDDAREPPPFPSCGNYDAKAWRFIREHASPGALFWNLGADPQPLTGGPAPEWHVGDSAVVLPQLDVTADFLFSCPPYGDLEVYSDDPADISTMPAEEFDRIYPQIVAEAVAKLREDRFACFIVGDFRDKRGFYRNFVSATIAAFEAAGARLYNEAILVTSVGSLPIRAAKQFRTTRKLGKTHQNVLVFVKGDPRKATAALGPVDVSGALADIEPEDEEA